jgi:anthranilate synthase component 2
MNNPNVLIIDNEDSFTYNLEQYIGELVGNVDVVRSKVVSLDDIQAGMYSHIVISPGSKTPNDAPFGRSLQVIKEYYKKFPILGVCLGHQGIGVAFDASIIQVEPMHGKSSRIEHSGEGIFTELPKKIEVMRYHSLAIDPNTLPAELVIDAVSDEGVIMAMHHKTHNLFGVQFHPESIGTETGKQLLANFLKINAD